MAEKRMFTKQVTDTDAFQEMPLSTQALYFHLNMHADDDGFVKNPKKITRMIGAAEDDLRLLVAKRFVIAFDASGILVIKHWRMHNTLRADRYHPTEYVEELRMLGLKSNKSYTDDLSNPDIVCMLGRQEQRQIPPEIEVSEEAPVNQVETSGKPSGNHMATTWQPSGTADIGIDKNRIGIEEISIDKGISTTKSQEEVKTLSNERVCRTKDVRRIMDAWNATGLKKVLAISPDTDRGKMTRKRVVDYGVDAVLEAINKIGNSKFCSGDNQKGWTATYDWFIRPSNFQKCLEGNYDDRQASSGNMTSENVFFQNARDMVTNNECVGI